MRLQLQLILLILALMSIRCKNSTNSTQPNHHEIAAANNARLERAFLSGDANAVAEIYTDSAKLSPDGENWVIGRNNILEFWKKDFANSKLLSMKTDVQSADGNEDILYETGLTTVSIRLPDSIYHSTVKYVNIWKKETAGSWKLDVDFWNSPGAKKADSGK